LSGGTRIASDGITWENPITQLTTLAIAGYRPVRASLILAFHFKTAACAQYGSLLVDMLCSEDIEPPG
jgi:hypothetical protein